MAETITVWHPHMRGIARQVLVDDLTEWTDVGWLENPPEIAAGQPEAPRARGVLERLADLEARPAVAGGMQDNGDGTVTIG